MLKPKDKIKCINKDSKKEYLGLFLRYRIADKKKVYIDFVPLDVDLKDCDIVSLRRKNYIIKRIV